MKNKILVVILMTILLIGGWYIQISSWVGASRAYNEYVKNGDEKVERKLYQEAIAYYKGALEIEKNCSCFDKMISAYEAYYAEEQSYNVRMELIALLRQAYETYPEESSYWERAIELCIEDNDYDNALVICKNAYDKTKVSDKLEKLKKEICYAYEFEGSAFSDYRESVNGYFITVEGDKWNWLSSDTERKSSSDYAQMSWIGSEGIFFCQMPDGELCYYDIEGVKRGIVELNVDQLTEMGVVNEGYCNIKYQDMHALIDLDGKVIAEQLLYCGSVQDGYAAVQDSDGVWNLVSVDGTLYPLDVEDIKCDISGRYRYGETIIAKKDGVYRFFNSNLTELKNEFTCIDIDVPSIDGIVAYQDESGLWGYVNYEGDIVIEPQYEAAKSFSNGLAAVCVKEKWGYINTKNELVMECLYEDCSYVSEQGSCFVCEEEDYYRLVRFRYPDLF